MIYHLAVGDAAARPLTEAFADAADESVVVLQDILHVGPLRRAEGESFGAMRAAYWKTLLPLEAADTADAVPDEARILEVSNALHKDPAAEAWLWMSTGPADVAAYLWSLGYLAQHAPRLKTVSIGGLPFLDREGKVFFPKSIGEILSREAIKARKLARAVTPTEIELDPELWAVLVEESAPLRTAEGGKKLTSRPVDYYDAHLLAACTPLPQKVARAVASAMRAGAIPTGDWWLRARLRALVEEGRLFASGDPARGPREWSVATSPVAATVADEAHSAVLAEGPPGT